MYNDLSQAADESVLAAPRLEPPAFHPFAECGAVDADRRRRRRRPHLFRGEAAVAELSHLPAGCPEGPLLRLTKGVGVDNTCLTTASSKFSNSWTKLEASGKDCLTTGDASSIENNNVDSFVNQLSSDLAP